MTIELLTLPDGRVLETSVLGPENALPLVFHHGTPGAATPPRVLQREVLGRGLRLVTYSRPGYGASTRMAGRIVADAVADTAAVLSSIGATASLQAGWSGGGPHALACAALLPGVRAALTIASIGPHDAIDLDFFAGMAVDNLEEFGNARTSEASLRTYLDAQRPAMLETTPAALVQSMAGMLPETDRTAMDGEMGEDLVGLFGDALRLGVDGWVDDDLAFIEPWGIDLGAIPVPVELWQGGLDQMVPAEHGAWLASKIPTARPHLLRSEGHVSLVTGSMGRMLDGLVAAK